jgi:phospholipase/carboxylesterase
MAAEIDGPRLAPFARGPARQLVVLLHGYGADGNDLIDIGRAWQELLPHAAFVSPHAPRPCGQAPVGREWFPLTFRDPDERWRGVNTAAPMLDRFLDAELARLALPASALALVGFSQGTMMALHVGLRHATAPVAIVGYSGIFVLPNGGTPEAVAAQIKSRPPILLLHGEQDDLIPRPWRPSTCRSNGTSPPRSATASTRRDCARAAILSPAAFEARSGGPAGRGGYFTFLSRQSINWSPGSLLVRGSRTTR